MSANKEMNEQIIVQKHGQASMAVLEDYQQSKSSTKFESIPLMNSESMINNTRLTYLYLFLYLNFKIRSKKYVLILCKENSMKNEKICNRCTQQHMYFTYVVENM